MGVLQPLDLCVAWSCGDVAPLLGNAVDYV